MNKNKNLITKPPKFVIKANLLPENNCNVAGCNSYKFGMINVCKLHYYFFKTEFNKSVKNDGTLSMLMIKNMFNTIIENKLNIKIYKLMYMILNFQKYVKERFSLKCKSSDKIKNFIKKYSKKELECSICTDIIYKNQSYAALSCGHTYHNICLNRWIKIKSCCPYCRSDNVFFISKNITIKLKYFISYGEILSAFHEFWEHKNLGYKHNFFLFGVDNLCKNSEITENLKCSDIFVIENIINNLSKIPSNTRFESKVKSFRHYFPSSITPWGLESNNTIDTVPSKKNEISSDLRKTIISMVSDIKDDKCLEIEGKNKIDYIGEQLIYTQINRTHNQVDLAKSMMIFFNNNDKIKQIFKENCIIKQVKKLRKLTIDPYYVYVVRELYYLIISNEFRFILFLDSFDDYVKENRYDPEFEYDRVLFNKLKRGKLLINKKDGGYYLYESELAERINKILNNNCVKKINPDDYQKLIASLYYQSGKYNSDKLKEIEKFYNLICANNISLSGIYTSINRIRNISEEIPEEITKIKINLVDIIDKKGLVFPIKTRD